MQPQGRELLRVRLDVPPRGIAVAGFELSERGQQASQILGSLVIQDIQIKRQDGAPSSWAATPPTTKKSTP